MSPKCKRLFVFVLFVLNLSSCARTKGYFSNQVFRENMEIKHKDPVLLASDSNNPFVLQVGAIAPTMLEASSDHLEVGENVFSAPLNVTTKRDLKNQKKVFQKDVASTINKFKAQNKIAEKKSGSTHWEPRVKIGVTLLLIGIVLSVFGLGLIGGISAFIGLLFTILGLLNTYY